MTPLKATLILLLTCHLAATAASRIGLERVRDIFITLPSSIQEDMKNEQEAIKSNERVGQLDEIAEELKILRARIQEKSKTSDDAEQADKARKPEETNIRSLVRDYEIKCQKAGILRADFETFKAEREKAMKKRMVISMRVSLNRVLEISQKLAIEQGFKIMIDSLGSANTGAPFILYNKDAIDLTDGIQAALKASEPAASTTPAAAAPEPAATPATKP